VDEDQPQLNCPSCGQSLRGLEPLAPGQVLRCPECGGVTSIQAIAANFVRHRAARHRLPATIGVTALAAWAVGNLLQFRSAWTASTAFLVLCFVIGATITGWFTILWHKPPVGSRLFAALGGGAIGALTAECIGAFAAPLAVIAWIFALHRWALARGYA
jgi:hypothetical protein